MLDYVQRLSRSQSNSAAGSLKPIRNTSDPIWKFKYRDREYILTRRRNYCHPPPTPTHPHPGLESYRPTRVEVSWSFSLCSFLQPLRSTLVSTHPKALAFALLECYASQIGYQSMTRNIPYERRPHLHSGESLKSRNLKLSSYFSGEGQVARPSIQPGK